MSFFSGSDGQLWFAEQTGIPNADVASFLAKSLIGKVKNWSFSSTTETLDVTSLGDTDRTFREGLRSATGSCSLFYYTRTDGTGTVQQLIEQQLGERIDINTGANSDDEPGKFSLKLLWGRGTNDAHYIYCRVAITSMTITMAVGEIMSADINFAVNGAPVKMKL